MSKIAIDVAEAKARAAAIDQSAAQIEKDIQEVYAVLNELRSSFIGNTATEFFSAFDNAYAYMEQWDDVVRRYAEELRHIATVMHRVDNG